MVAEQMPDIANIACLISLQFTQVELSMKLLKVDEEAIKVASKSIKPAIPSIDKFVDGTSIREMVCAAYHINNV